jgi:hypothetical protein
MKKCKILMLNIKPPSGGDCTRSNRHGHAYGSEISKKHDISKFLLYKDLKMCFLAEQFINRR